MKINFVLLCSVLFIVSIIIASCSKEKDEKPLPVASINFDTVYLEHSMKGWELYSWPNGSDWNFSILIGTNRLKSYEEVTGNRYIVCGIDSLKLLLGKLPEQEEIFWIGQNWLQQIWNENYENLCLPDKSRINVIQVFCTENKLVLSISN